LKKDDIGVGGSDKIFHFMQKVILISPVKTFVYIV